MKTKHETRRIELGRVSTATLGNEFKTIEQVGLQGAATAISDR